MGMSGDAMQINDDAQRHVAGAVAQDIPLGYKRAEVGIIPEDWQIKRLGELGNVVRGGSPRPAGDPRFFNGAFIPWLTVAALTNLPEHTTHVSETLSRLTEEGAKRSRTLDPGTLIIANSGATLGVAKILDLNCCANDGIAALINQRSGNKFFLCYYINTQTRRLRDVVATGNGQPNLNTALIAEIAVPFPRPAEQLAIAEALSDVDGLLGALEVLITKKRAIKLAAMQQLLTGKIRLPGFQGPWKAMMICELSDHIEGESSLGSDADYLEIGDIDVESKSYDLAKKEKGAVRGAVRVPAGTLLISTVRPTRGAIAVTTTSLYVSGAFCRLRPHNGLLFQLVCQQKFLAYLGEHSMGGTYPTCRKETILDYESVLPAEPQEQIAIAGVLSDMDAEIAVLEDRRAKTYAIKQGMMQQLLTGRTRLATAR